MHANTRQVQHALGDARARAQVLSALSARVAQVEGRMHAAMVSQPTAAGDPHRVPTGWSQVDAVLGGGLARRGVHEWCRTDDVRGRRCAPMEVLIHLAWQALLHDERHRLGEQRAVVWVGQAVWPQAAALVRGLRVGVQALFGGRCPRQWPDARLMRRSLLVQVAPHDVGARLWAVEQAARCPGVCAVVADGAGFDLTATRRLQLAATDTLLLVARPHERCAALSAAATRWRVQPDARGAALPVGHGEGSAAMDAGCAPTMAAGCAPTISAGCASTMAEFVRALAARLPREPAFTIELLRHKGACGWDGAVQVTHAWQWQGVDAVPTPVVAEARRRRERKQARLAARAAQQADERRREESMHDDDVPPRWPAGPAASDMRSLLHGRHPAQLDGVVHHARRAAHG